MMKTQLITISDEILSGTPVFFGTRVPVHNLVDYLASGETIEAFLDDFPSVSREQVIEFLKSAESIMVANVHEDHH
jgi:uncharacterized protein (DUF433 family)